MFEWIASLFGVGQEKTFSPRGSLRAGYDAAGPDDTNDRHWANADALSPLASADPATRKALRERARYEAQQNNSYAKGIVASLTNWTIGRGARLQLLTGDADVNRQVESRFAEWACAVRLGEKSRILKTARTVDGEAFAHFVTNDRLPTPVKLDLILTECDQFTSPFGVSADNIVDGVEYDAMGQPVAYYRLREHPGGGFRSGNSLQSDRLPADQVIHLFRIDRPGQVRGVSELAPALPLFAQLRRYTLAILSQCENAANISGVIYTTSPSVIPDRNDEPFASVETERGMNVTMPDGWQFEQFECKASGASYEIFKREILNEVARCLDMPFNIAAANSSKFNYSSGRLDHQSFLKSVRIEQSYFATAFLDRVLLAWLREATLIPGFMPAELRRIAQLGMLPPHKWFFDGAHHVDPVKEASAQQIRLANHTTTLADEYAEEGLDWEAQIEQRAKELALCRKLGLTPAQASPQQQAASPGGQGDGEEQEDDEADTETEDVEADYAEAS